MTLYLMKSTARPAGEIASPLAAVATSFIRRRLDAARGGSRVIDDVCFVAREELPMPSDWLPEFEPRFHLSGGRRDEAAIGSRSSAADITLGGRADGMLVIGQSDIGRLELIGYACLMTQYRSRHCRCWPPYAAEWRLRGMQQLEMLAQSSLAARRAASPEVVASAMSQQEHVTYRSYS